MADSQNPPVQLPLLQDQQFPSGIIKPRMLAADTTMKAGDMYYVNSSGIFQRLAPGTASQVLTMGSSVPAWSTPASFPSLLADVVSVSGTTPTLSCSSTRNMIFTITLSGNTTFSISNAQAGQVIMVEATQGSGTTYTNTWFSGITWVTIGGSAPTQTAVSSGITTYGFRVLTSSTFLGYLVGTN